MMNLLAARLVMLCLLLGLQCSNAATAIAEPVTNERSAAAIAEAAFLKDTKHEITDYSLHPGKHTRTEWYFFIDGEGKFLRPGNHWIVSVDRKTGSTKIVYGL
jgi:hypothetical protein